MPSLVMAQPSGMGMPLSTASQILPRAATLVAMSRNSTRCFFAGTAMVIGLLDMPAALAPKGAILGGLQTKTMPAISFFAAICE